MSIPDTVAQAPPEEERRLQITYEEFLAWSDEDTHAEWVDGEVIIHMPPKTVHQDVAGLPIGLQLAGLHLDETAVLRVAYAYEQATEWRRRWPPLATSQEGQSSS